MNNQETSIQTILYNHDIESIYRWLDTVCNSIDNAIEVHPGLSFSIFLGDCSKSSLLTEDKLKDIRLQFPKIKKIEYLYFNDNLGSAKGHNTLAALSNSEYLMTVNPDTVMAPNCILELFKLMEDNKTAIAEANQIPLEHPKEYDLNTGDTSWASTCCALIRREAFNAVSGFDDKHFFLHCDDVDFSWSVRLSGYRVRLNPKAIIFHNHGFDDENQYISTSAERRFSAIGALMLYAKYDRSDLLELTLDHFKENRLDYNQVLQDWVDHVDAGTIPSPIPNANVVAEFINGAYANHRW